jgi:hypothetical protein
MWKPISRNRDEHFDFVKEHISISTCNEEDVPNGNE